MCLTGGGEAGCENNKATANRTCNVPAGTALFLPLLNTELDNVGVDAPWNYSLAELIYWADYYTSPDQVSELHASIDGRSIPMKDLFRYRFPFAPFSYTLGGPIACTRHSAFRRPAPAGPARW